MIKIKVSVNGNTEERYFIEHGDEVMTTGDQREIAKYENGGGWIVTDAQLMIHIPDGINSSDVENILDDVHVEILYADDLDSAHDYFDEPYFKIIFKEGSITRSLKEIWKTAVIGNDTDLGFEDWKKENR